ncbi:MAG: DUF1015 domain-containing protein [Candidatus Lokiarchaeota archaeon]|nr:DUF1015 domain-containing protein [Candidatus Lokiarchaeota archaeon]
MVLISPLKPYIPINPEEFCTNPYDIISKEEEQELKRNSNSLIHLILPDGEGDEIYQNAATAYNYFKDKKIIRKEENPSIFVYRQESVNFSHQGLIIGVALQDYEDGNIVKHEHTRERPLKDRTNHIVSSNVAAGLVWTVFQANKKINTLIETIKKKDPKFDFEKYGYRHLLWQESDPNVIQNLKELFKNEKIYIADGHHRAASAAEYRKIKLEKQGITKNLRAPWQYLLSYVASDDQIRILPYNRVIRKLPLGEKDFLNKLEKDFEIIPMEEACNPEKKNEITICLKGNWYKLTVKNKKFKNKRDSLDVAILQDVILEPILGITDPRSDENIFFVGGTQDPIEREKYVTEKGNDLFINLYPVAIRDIESIADDGGVLPPKSTWFDPKVLSGLVLHDLGEN